MKNLELKVINGTQELDIKLGDSADDLGAAIMAGVFGFLGVPDKPAKIKAIGAPAVLEEYTASLKPFPDKPSKKLPILREPDTMAVPIGERIALRVADIKPPEKPIVEGVVKALQDPQQYTGIKWADEDTPLYQVRYYCKNQMCNHKGKRYVLNGTESIRCHECDTELKLRPAVDGQPLGPDKWNNFFIADELADPFDSYIPETEANGN